MLSMWMKIAYIIIKSVGKVSKWMSNGVWWRNKFTVQIVLQAPCDCVELNRLGRSRVFGSLEIGGGMGDSVHNLLSS